MALSLLLARRLVLKAVLILLCVLCLELGSCRGAAAAVAVDSECGEQLSPWNILQQYPIRMHTRVNVLDFGAKGDGVSDDSEAFLDAWSEACNLNYSVLIVPNSTYLLQPTTFSGPCEPRMKLQLDGTLKAPELDNWTSLMEYRDFEPERLSENQHQWLKFSRLDGLTVEGRGGFDGQGEQWWAQSCKLNHSSSCHSAPATLRISESNDVILRNLSLRNSPQMHLIFDACSRVRLFGLDVVAPGKSPNTDGIHLHASNDVVIQDCRISTGDDCVSIQTGTSNVRVKNSYCGPGHGLSIGSLGKDGGTANVTAVVVDGAVLNGTTNGLRIKTWQGGHGSVYGVRFQNVKMINVSNPIIIDQYYCDSRKPCQNQTSAVEVSGIVYKNVTGTSATPVAIKLACSDTVSCHDIVLQNINLTSVPWKSFNTTSFCENASGIVMGTVIPAMCF